MEPDEPGNEKLKKKISKVETIANRLFGCIEQVTTEEFFWQDANFNSNSRNGRELLYLIANDEWIPSTTERISLNRADLVDTDLVLEVDLAQIRHEAFHGAGGRVWLPLLVLPRPENAGPVSDLTVTDAHGTLQSTVRLDHIRHAASAALAETIANAASTHWPLKSQARRHAHRDLQLVLAAAVFRMLHGETRDLGASAGAANPDGKGSARASHREDRIGQAKEDLRALLQPHVDQATETTGQSAESREPAAGSDGRPSSAMRLAGQAVDLLDALSGTIVVAVTAERSMPSTVFTVSTPARKLDSPGEAGGKSRPDWVSRLRPHAELRIDLLLPSASADRYVEVHLPDGVSFTDASREGLAIKTKRPRSAAMLSDLMKQISEEPSATADVLGLADLAHAKATALSNTLSRHQIVPEDTDNADLHLTADDRGEVIGKTNEVRNRLTVLQAALTRLTSSPSGEALTMLKEAWGDGKWLDLRGGMLRETQTSRAASNTRTLVGVARSGQGTADQAEPVYARVVVPVKAAEARFVSIARLSGRMSAAMMLAVFFFLFSGVYFRLGGKLALPGVGAVAVALTLFSVIQAGRAEVPDRFTLRGFLSAGPGNSLILLSILPSILLVIALAFDLNGWVPVEWAGGTIALQVLLLVCMTRRVLYGNGRLQPRVLETPPAPGSEDSAFEYERTHVLRSAWWRTASANALVKNRPAFGYVVWGKPATLKSAVGSGLQSLRRFAPAPAESPNNTLSMLRASFGGRPMTFVVFRDPPRQEWTKLDGHTNVHLDLGEQAMNETPQDEVDVFVGFPDRKSHEGAATALAALCEIAGNHDLMVLNARTPEPPPGGDASRCWARLRLGLREGEYGNLRNLLRSMSSNISDVIACGQCHVLVRTARGGRMRLVHPAGHRGGETPAGRQRPVLASDLDPVVRDGTCYRVLAMHASTHIGIEHEACALLMAEVDMELVAVTYALLHGTSVFLLLGKLPGKAPANKDEVAGERESLRRKVASIGMRVDVDEFWEGKDLGTAANSPLLRVLLRTSDRPGALLDAADALTEALGHVFPGENPDADFWHGVLESGAARTTTVRLTRQLPNSDGIGEWTRDTLRGIEHRTRLGLTKRAAEWQARLDGSGEEYGAPEDAVVDVKLLKYGTQFPPVTSRDAGG